MKQKIEKSEPQISSSSYVHERAVLIGKVTLEDNTSVWPNAVLRADIAAIKIGRGSNVQDNACIHVDFDKPALIGENVTIGHNAVVHGAKVGDSTLIGMGAVVMESEIGPNCIIAAGSVLPAGKKIEAGSMVMGVPAKAVRKLSAEEIAKIKENAEVYAKLAGVYKKSCKEY